MVYEVDFQIKSMLLTGVTCAVNQGFIQIKQKKFPLWVLPFILDGGWPFSDAVVLHDLHGSMILSKIVVDLRNLVKRQLGVGGLPCKCAPARFDQISPVVLFAKEACCLLQRN